MIRKFKQQYILYVSQTLGKDGRTFALVMRLIDEEETTSHSFLKFH